MSPYLRIYNRYKEDMPTVDFQRLIGHHLQFGFCFATPDFFIMGRPVNRQAMQSDIQNPYCLFSRESSDAWYVHAMAGDMSKAWDILPWRLGFIGWDRLREGVLELTFHRTEDIRRLSRRESLPDLIVA